MTTELATLFQAGELRDSDQPGRIEVQSESIVRWVAGTRNPSEPRQNPELFLKMHKLLSYQDLSKFGGSFCPHPAAGCVILQVKDSVH